MKSAAQSLDELELDQLLESIYCQFHDDFRLYSRASLRRRLGYALPGFGCASLSALRARLLRDPHAFFALVQYLTIPVSDLFRDAPSFLALRRNVVPVLRTYPSLRVWVAGCSTGEEAYSFAILLAEEGLLERTFIYATDINQESLAAARIGSYSAERLALFTENHRLSGASTALTEHYVESRGSLQFAQRLREKIFFSEHSLATDGVFGEMQLISCRNVLIYFQRELQNRALGLFRDSLCRRGFLSLSSPETLRFTAHEREFEELPDRWYRRC